MNQALSTYSYFGSQRVSVNGASTNVASLVGKVNVHGYNGLAPWHDNTARQNLRRAVGSKRLWMSEYGDNDGSGMSLARSITEDLNHLRPTAWIYWQPVEPYSGWGLVNGAYGDAADEKSPTRGQPLWVYYKYYAFAQFSRFLRPGYKLIGSSDGNTIVGYHSGEKKLVLITVNYGTAQNISYDLRSLSAVPDGSAAMTTTNTDGSKRLAGSSVSLRGKQLTIRAEVNSISSIVVSGVSL
jgi:galactan endo-1,6-beta-galactosidase